MRSFLHSSPLFIYLLYLYKTSMGGYNYRMIKKGIYLLLSTLLGVIFTFPFTTHAQVNIEPSDIFFRITPEIPEPGQTVKVTAGSYVFTIDELYIEWDENGAIKLAGFGEKSFQFNAGKIGETKVVTATIRNNQGGDIIFKKQIVSKPSGLDILWQATDSYTPPFYKGKALPTTEGIVKIIALPTFQVGTQIISPKNVIYAWKRNFENIGQASGYGKNVLSIKQSYLVDQEQISVVANEPSGGSTAQGSLLIKPFEPKIVFYKKDPLLGIDFNNGINSGTTLSTNDTTLVAVPYFVTPRNILDPDLDYSWKLNDSLISTPVIKNQIVLRGTDEAGVATLELVIESAKKLFLTVKNSIDLSLQENGA